MESGESRQTVTELVKDYFTWRSCRQTILRGLFFCTALCASYLGYQTFAEYQWQVGAIIFCAMIAYDMLLAPTFNNFVHYTNRCFAVAFSIILMIFVGLAGCMSLVANKEDPSLTSLNTREATAQKNVDTISGAMNSPAMAMSGTNETLVEQQDQLRIATAELTAIQEEKQDYIDEQGGKYQDGSVRIYKVLADWYNSNMVEDYDKQVDADQAALFVLCLAWIAITSIQTVVSAAAHGIEVYRPSFFRGLEMLFDMFFSIKKKVYLNQEEISKLQNSTTGENDLGKNRPLLT